MTLGAVRRGPVARPRRIVLYGTEGVGKSTFAADAPSPIFLAPEDGASHLDVARFPEPHSWSDVLEAIACLERDAHDFRTLAIDSLDWLEPLCWAEACRRGGKSSIEDFGYGKGYAAALDLWRGLLARLDALRSARGLDVILIAHSSIRSFANPEGDDFDRYELKLHKAAAGLVKEWADAVLFARYEEAVVSRDGKRARGIGTGARVVHTERRPAFDAKNRFALPEVMPLSWADFDAACRAGRPAEPAELERAIGDALAKLSESDADKARAAITRANGDASKLAALLDWARAKAITTTNGGTIDA